MKTTLEMFSDVIASCFDQEFAKKLIAYRGNDKLQAKIDDFADRNTEGKLSSSELVEYRELIEVIGWFSVMQARARLYLQENLPPEKSSP